MARRVGLPDGAAKWASPGHRKPACFQVGIGQRRVYTLLPVVRHCDRPSREVERARLGGLQEPHTGAAPRPALGPIDQSCPNRVPLHVSTDGQEMLIGLDGERRESSLVEVPGADGVAVEVLAPHVRRREAVHEGLQITVALRPEDEVPVAGHHAVGEDAHRDPFERASDNPFECVVVAGVLEDPGALVGAVEDVEDHVPGSDACCARHGVRNWTYPLFVGGLCRLL